MALTTTALKAAKPRAKDYKLYDEKGLFVIVRKSGTKTFHQKYRYLGKERKLSFGSYPDISLSQAREKRDEARSLITQGIDPSRHKKLAKLAAIESENSRFDTVAAEWFEIRLSDKSESHKAKVSGRLKQYINPAIGTIPVSDLSAPAILNMLRPVETAGKLETAQRLKQIISQVMRYAIATGRAERDPAADLKGALKTPKKKHHAAIVEPAKVGLLLDAIDHFDGTLVVRAALRLSPLLFLRPGELRSLKWSDIHDERNRIEIVSQKTEQPMIIPLATQAREILSDLKMISGRGDYIFPSARGRSRPMSENAVRTALRTMGFGNDEMTPHGFRALARTLLDEELGYRTEWIEQQLGHEVRDMHGRAYNRTHHLEGRTEMMQAWADYLDTLRKRN